MNQFSGDNNVLVGTIPDIEPIILPNGNPFTNRVMQLEKMMIVTTDESLEHTIQFWIQLTRAADTVFKVFKITTPKLNEDIPYLHSDEMIKSLPQVVSAYINELLSIQLNEKVTNVLDQLAKIDTATLLNYGMMLSNHRDDAIPKEFHIFINMSLKILFVKNASQAKLPKLAAEQSYSSCPMCDDDPIASVIDPMDNALRYLVCQKCETKWHKVRSTCHNCVNTGQMELLSIEELDSVMKAESCPSCNIYIKHIDRTKNPLLDLFAEDLKTMPLDFLLAEDNLERKTFNIYLK